LGLIEATLKNANLADSAKLLSLALSVADTLSIINLTKQVLEGKNLNEQLFKTMQEDELLALANLFYRLGNYQE
jgi:hypothetical protein